MVAALFLVDILPGYGAALAQQNATTATTDQDDIPEIEADLLWESQPALVGQAAAAIGAPLPGRPNVYAMTIAPDGTQPLFSTEAHAAATVLASHFGDSSRGTMLLSNGVADLMHAPLATRTNMAAAAMAIGKRIDPDKDLVVIYLTSHGSPEAMLSTALPDEAPIQPISAVSLAGALDQAHIHRRVIIISACFSGSWIPALANDDTIVLTAAREDRTSFGCSNDREMTFFGEAFLEGPLGEGASLRDGFAAARKTIARWEKADDLEPSMPQAFVGRNMQAVWLARGASVGGARSAPATTTASTR
jgi:hypothetical protein